MQQLLINGEEPFDSRIFDIFSFTKLVGREKTLPLLALNMFLSHKLMSLVNEPKFAHFMNEVFLTYK